MGRGLRAAALSLALAASVPVLAQQAPDPARLRDVREIGVSTPVFLDGRTVVWEEPAPHPPCRLTPQALERRTIQALRSGVAGLRVLSSDDMAAEGRALVADMAASERLVRESRGGPVPPQVREIEARAERRGAAMEERPYVLVRSASGQSAPTGLCLGSVVTEVRVIPRDRPAIRGDRFIAPAVLYEDAPCPIAARPGEAFQAAAEACVTRAMERLSAVLIAGRNLPAPPPPSAR